MPASTAATSSGVSVRRTSMPVMRPAKTGVSGVTSMAMTLSLGRLEPPVSGLRQFLLQDRAGDDVAQYLGRTATDGEHTHVARHAFQRQIARIAARAEDLQCVVDDGDGVLRCE